MNDRSRQDRENRGNERNARELRGDDFYYGGQHSQREDWRSRNWDNNDFDRREGMYGAGGRDFEERFRGDYPDDRNDRDRGWWASHSPMSGERPWYEDREPRHPRFTGGDRGWSERRRGGIVEGVKSFFGVGPKGYRRSDERIHEEVCEALSRHPEVNASDIEVKVEDGHVILTGTVESRWMKRAAEDAVEYVTGVLDVHNELTIPRNTDSSGELEAGGRPRKVQ